MLPIPIAYIFHARPQSIGRASNMFELRHALGARSPLLMMVYFVELAANVLSVVYKTGFLHQFHFYNMQPQTTSYGIGRVLRGCLARITH